MADVNVGVKLAFEGFDSSKISKEVEKIQDELSKMKDLQLTTEIGFEEGTVQNMDDFVTSLRRIVNDMNDAISRLESSSSIGLGAQDVDALMSRMQKQMQDAMQEALSRAFKGSGATKDVKRQMSKAAEEANEQLLDAGSGTKGEIFQFISETEAKDQEKFVDRINSEIDEMEKGVKQARASWSKMGAVIARAADDDIEHAAELQEKYGKFVLGSMQNLKKLAADDALGEVENRQEEVNKGIKTLSALYDQLAQAEDIEFFGTDLEKQLDTGIDRLIEMSKRLEDMRFGAQEFKDQFKNVNAVTTQAERDFAEFAGLMDKAGRQWQQALTSQDPSVIQGFLRPFENLNQKISETNRKLQKARQNAEASADRIKEEIDTIFSGDHDQVFDGVAEDLQELDKLKSELTDIEKKLKQIQEGEIDATEEEALNKLHRRRDILEKIENIRQGEQGEQIRQAESLLEKKKQELRLHQGIAKRADEQLKKQNDMFIQVRQTVQQFRSLERIFKQNNKFIENSQRKALELDDAFDAAVKTVGQIKSELRSAGKNAFNKTNILAAKQAISGVESNVKKLRKTLGELEVARNLELKKLEKQAQGRKGPFSEAALGDQENVEDALEKAKAATNERFGELEKELRSRLDEAEALEGVTDDLEKFVDKSESLEKVGEDVNQLGQDISNLENRFQKLNETNVETTEDLQIQANQIGEAREEWTRITKEISRVEAELRRMSDEGGEEVESLKQDLQELRKQQERLSQSGRFQGGNLQQAGRIEQEAKDIKKAGEGITQLGQDLGKLQQRMQRANNIMDKTQGTSGEAARELLKIGKNAESARQDLIKYVTTLEQAEQNGRELTDEQRRLVKSAREMINQYGRVSGEINRAEGELKRTEEAARNAGQGFNQYSSELADSVLKNFKFINAIGIVTSALMGLQQAFEEILDESRAVARAMTVMESTSMSFGKTLKTVKENIRVTARQLGVRVDEASEAVFQLGSAGLSAEESMKALLPTMKAVVGTQGDVQELTKAIAGSYNVFGEQIKRTEGQMGAFTTITDTLTAVFQDHQVEMSELVQGFNFASASASAAGFSFQDTAAFLAVLNDNMIKSGRAGRGLQNVFSKIARKSDDLASLFNINVNPNQTLPSQFLTILEQLNNRINTTALSTRDLRKSFEVAGLRGGRSFITLVKNIDDVKETMDDLNNASGQTTNRVNEIVQQSLARQFQRAKQALLGLVRQGLDPAIKGLKIFANIITQISQGLQELGPIRDFIVNLTILGSTLGILYQSGQAVFKVVTALMGSFKGWIQSISTTNGNIKNASDSVNNFNGVVKQTNASVKETAEQTSAVGGRFSKFTNAVGAAIVALPIIIGIIGHFSQSAEELKRKISDLQTEIQEIERGVKAVEDLENRVSEIGEALEQTNVSANVAGDAIKDAFDKAGKEVVGFSDVATKSNTEVANSVDNITDRLRERLEVRRALAKDAKTNKFRELSSTRLDLLEEQFGNFGSSIIGTETEESLKVINRFEESYKKANEAVLEGNQSLDEFIKKNEEIGTKVQTTGRGVATRTITVGGKELAKSGGIRDLKEFRNQIESELGEAEESVRIKMGLISDTISAVAENPQFDRDAAERIVQSKIIERVGEEAANSLFDRYRETIRNNIKPTQVELVNANDEILSSISTVREAFSESTIPTTFFNSILEDAQIASQRIEETRGAIADLSTTASDRVFTFEAETIEKAYEKPLKDLAETTGESLNENLIDAFSTLFPEEAARGAKEMKTVGQTLNAILNQYKNDQGEIVLQAEELVKLNREIGEVWATSKDESSNFKKETSRALANMKAMNQVSQVRNVLLEGFVKRIQDSFALQTNLNNLVQKEVSLMQKINTLSEKRAKESGRSIKKEYQTIIKNLGRLAKESQENIRKAAQQGLSTGGSLSSSIKNRQKLLEENAKKISDRNNLNIQIVRGMKELVIEEEKRLIAIEESRQELENVQEQNEGIIENLENQIELETELVDRKISLLEAQDKITGNIFESQEAISEMISVESKLLQLREQLLNKTREMAKKRFELIANARKALSTEKDFIPVREKILSSAVTLSDAKASLEELNKEGVEDLSAQLHHHERIIESSSSILEIEKELKENQKDQNKLVQDRAQTLQKIVDSYGREIEFFSSKLQSILERQFEISPLQTAQRAAALIPSLDVANVLRRQGEAIDIIIEKTKEGAISLRNFGQGVSFIGEKMRENRKEQSKYEEQLRNLRKEQLAQTKQQFSTFLQLGKFEEAQGSLSRISTLVDELFQSDTGSEKYRQQLEGVLELRDQLTKRLEEAEAGAKRQIKARIDIENKDSIVEFFDQLRTEIKNSIEQLNKLGGNDNINKAIQAIQQSNRFRGLSEGVEQDVGANLGALNQKISTLSRKIDEASADRTSLIAQLRRTGEQFNEQELSKMASRIVQASISIEDAGKLIKQGGDQFTKGVNRLVGEPPEKLQTRPNQSLLDDLNLLMEGMQSSSGGGQSVPNFQEGGVVPGGGLGDDMPAMLESGEFVIPKEVVQAYGRPFFEQLRKKNPDRELSTIGGKVGKFFQYAGLNLSSSSIRDIVQKIVKENSAQTIIDAVQNTRFGSFTKFGITEQWVEDLANQTVSNDGLIHQVLSGDAADVVEYIFTEETGVDFAGINKDTIPGGGGSRQDVGLAFGGPQFTLRPGALGTFLSNITSNYPGVISNYIDQSDKFMSLARAGFDMDDRSAGAEIRKDIAAAFNIAYLRDMVDMASSTQFQTGQIRFTKRHYVDDAVSKLHSSPLDASEMAAAIISRKSVHAGRSSVSSFIGGHLTTVPKKNDKGKVIDHVISSAKTISSMLTDGDFDRIDEFDFSKEKRYGPDKVVKKQSGGFIPGSGRGDKVPALLEPGEFVIPRDSTQNLSEGFLRALQHGEIQGLRGGGFAQQIISATSGSSSFLDEIVIKVSDGTQFDELLRTMENVNDNLSSNTPSNNRKESDSSIFDSVSQGLKSVQDEFNSFFSDVKDNIEKLKNSSFDEESVEKAKELSEEQEKQKARQAEQNSQLNTVEETYKEVNKQVKEQTNNILPNLFETIKGGFEQLPDFLSSVWGGFIENILVPEFAFEIGAAFDKLQEKLTEIDENFEDSIASAQEGIQKNRDSYFSYLDSIEKAEQKRIEKRIEAEEKYREKVEELKEDFVKGFIEAGTSVIDQMNKAVGNFVNKTIDGITEKIRKQGSQLFSNLGGKISNITSGAGSSAGGGATSAAGGATSAGGGIFGAGGGGGGGASILGGAGGAAAAGAGLALAAASLKTAAGVWQKTAQGVLKVAELSLDPENFNKVLQALRETLRNFPERLSEFADDFRDNLESVTNLISEELPSIVNAIEKELPKIVNSAVKAIDKVFPKLIDGLVDIMDELGAAAGKLLSSLLSNILNELPNIAVGIVDGLLEAIKNLDLSRIFEGLVTGLATLAPKLFASILKNLPSIISALVREAFEIVFVSIPKILISIAKSLVNAIKQFVISVFTGEIIIQYFKSIIKQVRKAFSRVFKGIVNKISNFVGRLGQNIKKTAKNIGSFLNNNVFKNIGSGIDNIVGEVLNIGEKFKTSLQKALSIIPGVKGPNSDKKGIFKTIGDGVKKGIKDVGNFLGFNKGGYVPGTGRGDKVPAMLEPGEFVIPKNSAKNLNPALLRNLQEGNIQRFQTGGMVQGKLDSISNSIDTSGFNSVQRNNVNNNVEVRVEVKESDNPARTAQQTAEEIDKRMAKKVQDNDSELYDQIRRN